MYQKCVYESIFCRGSCQVLLAEYAFCADRVLICQDGWEVITEMGVEPLFPAILL